MKKQKLFIYFINMYHLARTLLKPKPVFIFTKVTRGYTDDITSPIQTGTTPDRIKRQEPGKVICGFIPEDWPKQFHSRTGITGFGIFCFTFGIYLMSKEKLVMEHEYYGGLSTFGLWYLVSTQIGPQIGAALDKEVDAFEAAWNESRVMEKNMLEASIKDEENMQLSSEAQLLLVEAKRQNIGLQLEANFRERQMMAYNEVKKRLDYYVRLEEIERRFAQRNIVAWVTDQVLKSITPEQEARNIDTCIEDLAAIANK